MGGVLVLGSTGLLGQALMREGASRGLNMLGAARRGAAVTVDITNPAQVFNLISAHRPMHVVNAAAIVDLAACNSDPGLGYIVNARAVSAIADACAHAGARLTHISTDHFFTGDAAQPHDEHAPVQLLNEYARSKYAGEAFAATLPDAQIIRTNVVGIRGWRGQPTFAEWCLSVLASDSEITLFEDYFTSPIEAGGLAAAILDLMAIAGATGIINVAGSEIVSKERFFLALAEALGRTPTRTKRGSVKTLSVRRAESCGLNVAKAEALLGRQLPRLDQTIKAVIAAQTAAGTQF